MLGAIKPTPKAAPRNGDKGRPKNSAVITDTTTKKEIEAK